jgi:mono/diheme cytochrome c family protein
MIIGFIVFWVVLGLAVFFTAMRGGPRAVRQSLHTESKAGQRILSAGIILLFAVGMVVPTLVLAFNGANKASVGPGGLHLNAEQQKGRDLFARSCAVCHTLTAVRAVGRTGPNLDVLIPGIGASEPPNVAVSKRSAFVLSAISEGRARGNGQMPALLYQGREAQSVANFVATVAGH